MRTSFTEEDVGKTVLNPNGEPIGMIAGIAGEVARVDPDPGITDTIKAALGWETAGDATFALEPDRVGAIEADAVYVREPRQRGPIGESESAIDGRESVDDRTAGDEPAADRSAGSSPAEGRSAALGPDEPIEPRDGPSADDRRDRGLEADPEALTERDPEARFEPESRPDERTDAAVDPTDEERRDESRTADRDVSREEREERETDRER